MLQLSSGRDLRHSVRALRKTPAFAAGAIATVALTVGATTAIFSVVYGVLLRQLPYRAPQQVFWIWSDQPGRDRTPFNVPDFVDYRDSIKTLSGFAGFFAISANLSDDAAPERVQGMRATGNLFDILGAPLRLGRGLEPGDEQAGADRVAVVSEPFWVRRFGADPALIGRSIRLNGEPFTVVGVLAGGFVTPIRDVDFVLPFSPDRDPRRGARNSVNFIIGAGRLADGVSAPQAASELTAIAHRLQQQFPVENARKRGVRLVGALDGIVGSFRTALVTLFVAVAAVLLIACANLANLLLTRAAARRKDMAVRLALGASRTAVARQVLTEALLLAAAGGTVGVLLARWGAAGLVALAPTALPRASDIRVDTTVMLFSLIVSTLTAVLFGAVPALVSARVDLRDALQGSGRGVSGGGRRLRGAFVASEVALAVALLVVMTMMAKSFANVQGVTPGFDSAHVLSARLTLPAKRFATREALLTFQRALTSQLRLLPGVTDVGAITLMPLSGLAARVPFTVEGRPVPREQVPLAQFRTVSAGYFEAARIPVTRGRSFSEADTERTRPVAVVSEALASRWFAGTDPIGARLLVDDNDGPPRPIEIVGVVGNVQQIALDEPPTWDLYLVYPQIHADNVGAAAGNMFWIVRTAGEPMTLAGSLAREVRRLDPEVVASQVRPLDAYLTDSVAPRRFSLSLMAAFGAAALVLALTGIYAVTAYSVNQRAREIGIRSALGANQAAIVRLIAGQSGRFVLAGLAIGLAAAFGASQLLTTLLFGIAPTAIATYLEVATVVAGVSLAACLAPTLRAARLAGASLRAE
jgi:predicted permease